MRYNNRILFVTSIDAMKKVVNFQTISQWLATMLQL